MSLNSSVFIYKFQFFKLKMFFYTTINKNPNSTLSLKIKIKSPNNIWQSSILNQDQITGHTKINSHLH